MVRTIRMEWINCNRLLLHRSGEERRIVVPKAESRISLFKYCKPVSDTERWSGGGMLNDPQIVFRVYVQVAQLDEIGAIFRNELRKRGEFDRIVGASGEDEIVEGYMAVVLFHHCYRATDIRQGKAFGAIIEAMFFRLGAV